MKTGWRILLPLAAFSMAMPFLTGCGGGGGEAAPPTASAGSESEANAPTGPLVTPPTVNQATVVENGVETDAAKCVAVFLDSLRRGDEKAANGVLTPKAQEELAKTSYVIMPLGTPEGQYSIGRVGFPYPEKDVALVECTWTEPAAPGQQSTPLEIVCEVHQETVGWRIAGMGVTMEGSDEALVLDFEDAASIESTITGATTPAGQQAAPAAGEQVAGNVPANLPQQQVAAQQLPQQGQMPNMPSLQYEPPQSQGQFPQFPNQQVAGGQQLPPGQVQPASSTGLPAYPPAQQAAPQQKIAYPPQTEAPRLR